MQLKLLLALVIEKLCYHARFSPGVYRLELLAGRVARNDRLGVLMSKPGCSKAGCGSQTGSRLTPVTDRIC